MVGALPRVSAEQLAGDLGQVVSPLKWEACSLLFPDTGEREDWMQWRQSFWEG